MESSPTTCLPYKRTWKLRQSVNKEHLKSTSGILGVFELVSVLTGFIALLHYVKIVAKTTATNNVFFVTTSTTFAFRAVLFILMTFNLQQKLMTSNKHWNLFMLIFTSITGVLLFISSSLLASEAVKVGDAYHSLFPEHTKCLNCSKINIAAVFGFLSGILFTADFCVYLRQNESTSCARRETRVTVHHVAPVSEIRQLPTTSVESTSVS